MKLGEFIIKVLGVNIIFINLNEKIWLVFQLHHEEICQDEEKLMLNCIYVSEKKKLKKEGCVQMR